MKSATKQAEKEEEKELKQKEQIKSELRAEYEAKGAGVSGVSFDEKAEARLTKTQKQRKISSLLGRAASNLQKSQGKSG